MIRPNPVERFNDIRFKFRFLNSLHVEKSEDASDIVLWQIEIVLAEIFLPGANRINLRFSDCFGVKTRDIYDVMAIELQILDARDRQIEGARYRIVDNEGSAIEFYCLTVDIS